MSDRFLQRNDEGVDITLTRLIIILGAALCATVLVCVTLARPLSRDGACAIFYRADDGVTISYAPSREESPDTSLVNINTAGIDELTTLPGIGRATAEAIVKYREEIGFFKSIDELLDVSGIGEKKLEAIRELVRVD